MIDYKLELVYVGNTILTRKPKYQLLVTFNNGDELRIDNIIYKDIDYHLIPHIKKYKLERRSLKIKKILNRNS